MLAAGSSDHASPRFSPRDNPPRKAGVAGPNRATRSTAAERKLPAIKGGELSEHPVDLRLRLLRAPAIGAPQDVTPRRHRCAVRRRWRRWTKRRLRQERCLPVRRDRGHRLREWHDGRLPKLGPRHHPPRQAPRLARVALRRRTAPRVGQAQPRRLGAERRPSDALAGSGGDDLVVMRHHPRKRCFPTLVRRPAGDRDPAR